jgi:hypothetical protein
MNDTFPEVEFPRVQIRSVLTITAECKTQGEVDLLKAAIAMAIDTITVDDTRPDCVVHQHHEHKFVGGSAVPRRAVAHIPGAVREPSAASEGDACDLIDRELDAAFEPKRV